MSVYHFFKDLTSKHESFYADASLSAFPFDRKLLSCWSKGKFPDTALRLRAAKPPFSGGELIEFKDAKNYMIASFNSTIPSARKSIREVVGDGNGKMAQQMREAGDDIDSMPMREVFYLVRGRRRASVKICLLHGSFFETIPIAQLIRESLDQVFSEAFAESGEELSEEVRELLLRHLDKQRYFRQVRKVEKSSVNLRFRVMTEAKREGNILNGELYPQIVDDSLNLILPLHREEEKKVAMGAVERVFGKDLLENFVIQHPFNGKFVVFQKKMQKVLDKHPFL